MKRREEQYQDFLARLFPSDKQSAQNVTFQVTDDCNLRCTYCYQIHKGHHSMPFDVAKKFIDMLIENSEQTKQYIDSYNSTGLIMEFIGGEPFLEVDLIDQIIDYFVEQLILNNHPWQYNYRISICSNGLNYFDDKVQDFIKRRADHLSFNISIDGNKELHDSCRIQPNGEGSYDIAMAGVQHFREQYSGMMGSKMTLAPANIAFTAAAVKSLIESGYDDINLNCVFEKGWDEGHATVLYYQLKELADYLIDNDLYDKIRLSIFVENFFRPKSKDDTQTWCWGAGTPILTPQGYKNIEDLKIGDFVYTEDGSIHPIINTLSHYAENVVAIKLPNTNTLVCTDNHKVYAKPFDYIGNRNTRHWKKYEKYEIKDLTKKDMIRQFQIPFGTVQIDKEIAYLIGRYIGDGWDCDNHKAHSICCAFEETEELLTHFDKAKIDYYVVKNKTVNQIGIKINNNENNKILHNYLSMCGHLAHDKHLPNSYLSWNEESLKNLLDGYLDADGYYDKIRNKYKINTVSKKLSEDLLLLLNSLGYATSISLNKRGGKSFILNREVNIKDRYEIVFYKDFSKSRYSRIIDDKLFTSHLQVSPAEPQMVYNITVDTNHSYIAGGIASSNCGGLGKMISVDWKGDIYPCIRYMESSLGDSCPPVIVGNVYTGMCTSQEQKDCVACMRSITRLTESTEECINCSIAEGCAECSAYNYQDCGGGWNHRATYICVMHQARALANAYYYNKQFRKNGEAKRMKIWLEKEKALNIISEQEWDMLKELEYPAGE